MPFYVIVKRLASGIEAVWQTEMKSHHKTFYLQAIISVHYLVVTKCILTVTDPGFSYGGFPERDEFVQISVFL
jgi:hypothetical protein